MSRLRAVLILLTLCCAASAQTGLTLDSSGNGKLQGSFRFRHLAATATDANGDPTEMTAAAGVITFDGKRSEEHTV